MADDFGFVPSVARKDGLGFVPAAKLPGLPPLQPPPGLVTDELPRYKVNPTIERFLGPPPEPLNPYAAPAPGEGKIRQVVRRGLQIPFRGPGAMESGAERMSRPEMSEKFGGAADIAGGAMDLATPFIPEQFVKAPARTVLGLGAGILSGEGTQVGLQKLGVAPGYAQAAGTGVGLLTGGRIMTGGKPTIEGPPPLPVETKAPSKVTTLEQLQDLYSKPEIPEQPVVLAEPLPPADEPLTASVRQPSNLAAMRNPVEPAPTEVKPIVRDIDQQKQELYQKADPRNNFPDIPESADVKATEPAPPPPKTMKDVSALRALTGSPDNVLSEIPQAKPIVDTILGAEDQKEIFRAKSMQDLAATSKGLNLQQRQMMGELLDTAADPTRLTGLRSPRFGQVYTADLTQRAAQARALLNQVHAQFPEGAPREGGPVGYISNYLTHIWKTAQADSDIKGIVPELWDNYFRRPFENIRSLAKRDELPLPVAEAGKPIGGPKLGVGRPSSRFVEAREGKLQDYELDVNRIFPAYVDSAAKVIFDLPAVKQAQELGRALPEGSIARQLATDWVRHYAGFERGSVFNRRWDRAISSLVGMTSRSVLFWSGQLQSYHLARIALNTYPNLGAKYFGKALGDFTRSPIAAWTEARDAGLIPNATTPLAFKSKGQIFDDVGNIFGMADFIDRSLAYKGYLAKYVDAGMEPGQARLAAVRDAKAASIIVSPARSTRMAQLGPIGKLIATYKQIPVRIIEQYAKIARNAQANPGAATRLASMITASIALQYGTGIKTMHISPDAYSIAAPVEEKILRITNALLKGDIEKALTLTTQWMLPGGTSVVNQLNEGQPSFMAKQKAEE